MTLPTCDLRQRVCNLTCDLPLCLSDKQLAPWPCLILRACMGWPKSFTYFTVNFSQNFIYFQKTNKTDGAEATVHVSTTWRYVMLSEKPTLILTLTRLSLFQPIRTHVILSNVEAPYSDQSRASNTVNITWSYPLSVTHLPAVTIYTSCSTLLQLLPPKYVIKTNIYGGITPQNFGKSQNFEIQKLFGPPFLGSGSLAPFRNSLVPWVLTTFDVSTTFPSSFFTV